MRLRLHDHAARRRRSKVAGLELRNPVYNSMLPRGVKNRRERPFHKFRRNRDEFGRERRVSTRRDEDETVARVFQGHLRVGRTGTGMIHVEEKS